MAFFTEQERKVVFFLILIVFSGSVLQYAFKEYPLLYDAINLIDGDRLFAKVDINTASFDELVEVPYIGRYTASNILQYRQQRGPFKSLEELKNIKGIKKKNYERFSKFLISSIPR